MTKSLTRYSDCQWTNKNVSEVVIECYAEIVGIKPVNLPPEMYDISDSQSIDTIFAANKAEEVCLFFRVGDTTIEIDTKKVRVKKENENKKSAYWKDENR